jgi:hypothetical protein
LGWQSASRRQRGRARTNHLCQPNTRVRKADRYNHPGLGPRGESLCAAPFDSAAGKPTSRFSTPPLNEACRVHGSPPTGSRKSGNRSSSIPASRGQALACGSSQTAAPRARPARRPSAREALKASNGTPPGTRARPRTRDECAPTCSASDVAAGFRPRRERHRQHGALRVTGDNGRGASAWLAKPGGEPTCFCSRCDETQAPIGP